MIPRTMRASRTARARELAAERKMIQHMHAYVERMAPQWSDAQLIQAMTHVGRQSKWIEHARHQFDDTWPIEESARVTRSSATREVGRCRMEVRDLYGLSH